MKLLGDITVVPYFMDFLWRMVALNQLVTQKYWKGGSFRSSQVWHILLDNWKFKLNAMC
jgi:hypothetical protein